MSMHSSVVVISSDSDSDAACDSRSSNKTIIIELIDSDDNACDDDDVQTVKIESVVPNNTPAVPAADVCTSRYFAPKNGLLLPWHKCRIVSMHNNVYTVVFYDDDDDNVYDFPRYQMAADRAPKMQLWRGTRVIAVQMPKGKVNYYYAGVIGESVCASNNYEYLIFFDNGHAQYVRPSHVRVVEENDRWQHVHENAKQFMKYRFEGVSANDQNVDLPIVSEECGTEMKVEYNGKWQQARIVATRGESLIQILFKDIKRSEWLYRGSPRLGPIWRKYMKKVPEVGLEISVIEAYSSLDDDSVEDSNEYVFDACVSPLGVAQNPKNAKSTIQHYRLKANEQRGYRAPLACKSNVCSPRCCTFDATKTNLKAFGPLMWPMIMGWTRVTKKRSMVLYTTPCSRVMRNTYEVKQYLQTTECKLLDVDSFCFDQMVDCMRYYETEQRYILRKDLTNGAEATPIPVINEFNRDMPNKFTYVTQNRLHRNVTNFLSDHVVSMAGCDCTDDCYDRYECPCRRLTEAGYCYADTPREPFGYNYKRLDIAVGTGIFECNVNCKCSKKCANRVAQLPLAHHLELFKTKKCGWGVRCRNDLPSGTFICCYFGDLMTEEQAEQVAKNHGDCYLAQLNFIELADEMKHGYEAYAVTPPDSDCDSGKTVERPSANRPCSLESDDNSSAGNSTSTSGYEVNETILKVINYFPKVEPTNDTHPTRQLYGPKEMDYIIDGKRHGNIGRFFNHSCDPNMFLQSIFIDTHDLRFPRLALFTLEAVKAGTELKWNYNYVVGSVPNRAIICECGAKNCRGRLL